MDNKIDKTHKEYNMDFVLSRNPLENKTTRIASLAYVKYPFTMPH